VRAAPPNRASLLRDEGKWMGKEKLAYWDRNAPLPEKPGASSPGRTRKRSCSAPTTASRRTCLHRRRFFDGAWIDAPVREGRHRRLLASHRAVGAPYILMNYQGKPRDVMTLAHESVMACTRCSRRRKAPARADAATLAETASVFGEVADLQGAFSRRLRAKGGRRCCTESRGHDQHRSCARCLYCFERKVHEERRTGELTPERLGQSGWRCRAAWPGNR